MGLLKWYSIKKRNALLNLNNSHNALSSNWENFKKRKTYLTYYQKDDLGKQMSHAKRTELPAWYLLFSKEVRKNIKQFNEFLGNSSNEISKYNGLFIESRLSQFKNMFDGKLDGLKVGLDSDQRLAVVIDDKHNMVIAGAGSGKTEILASKIAYLVRRKDKIAPENILALAFNKDAVANIESRLKTNYKINNVNVKTFHKLGRDIIFEKTEENPKLFEGGEDWKIKIKIKEIIDRLLKNKQYQDLFLEYLSSHLEEDEVTFEQKEEYYAYMQNKRYTTLRNEKVKSISEKDIANFLFKHGINYQYEPAVDWIKDKNKNEEYKPDFYLPKPFDLYIENWGLNRKMQVPEWFTQSSEKYNKIRQWKLDQFKRCNKQLIETWDYERNEGTLLSQLLQKLNDNAGKIQINEKSYEEIVEETSLYKENKSDITDMISSFITLSKANSISINEIKNRINSKDYTERQKLFAKLAIDVLKEYQAFLRESKHIDFNDMILDAVEIVRNNPGMFKNKYDYILVDEFQDISKPRLDLINALVDCNKNTKLFVVGDDWQSINGFAGAEVEYFINFADTFERPAITPLKMNYRSSKSIVEMSNKLISNNKNRIDKVVLSNQDNGEGVKGKVILLPKGYEENPELRISRVIGLVKDLLAQGVHPSDILILSRFNRILNTLQMHCLNNKIPVNDEKEMKKGIKLLSVHKSKGLQAKNVILLDVVSGTYGFPSEMRDNSVLEIAKNKREKDAFEEERRLFYVALTRSKEFIYIFTVDKNKSVFLNEIKDYLETIL